MTQAYRRLQAGAQKLRVMPVTQIEEVFGQWVCLPKTFGQSARIRLFSPLTRLLAISLASSHEGWVMQGDCANVPCMACRGETENRLT